jgi:branched-chain amino acid transport system permease protein
MTAPAFITWLGDNETLIQSALIFALLAFGFQVALRSGVYTFAAVGCWAIGAYVTGILMLRGWATLPATVVAIGAAALVSLLLALVLGRLRALYLAMATVAFDLLVILVASTLEITGGPTGLYGIPLVTSTPVLLAVVAACALVLRQRERGHTGRQLEVMRTDERLAPALGIDVFRQRINASVLSGVLGALSGALYITLVGAIAPTQAGFELIVTTLTMAVIGGTSSWAGPLLGAFVVTWLPEVLGFIGDWWPAVQGLILVVIVIYARDGLIGIVRGAVRRARHLRAARTPEAREVPA